MKGALTPFEKKLSLSFIQAKKELDLVNAEMLGLKKSNVRWRKRACQLEKALVKLGQLADNWSK